jgi:heme a synthase
MDRNLQYPSPDSILPDLDAAREAKARRYVSNWILIGVFMLLIQVVLGGITRLTGSGLSITEWNVVTGALPPLNEDKWTQEFNKYRQTPQYQLLNSDFTLSDFKFIFFWEWFHRFWALLDLYT